MENNDIINKILNDEDYIRSPKFADSLSAFLNKNPDGVENPMIAKLLMMSEDEVEKTFQEAISMLREKMVD